MKNHLPDSSAYYKQWSSLNVFAKIIVSIGGTGLLFLFGFWLLIASNMGSMYLPKVCNGCLDFWIRMILLGSGIGILLIIAVGLILLILHCFCCLIGCNRKSRWMHRGKRARFGSLMSFARFNYQPTGSTSNVSLRYLALGSVCTGCHHWPNTWCSCPRSLANNKSWAW